MRELGFFCLFVCFAAVSAAHSQDISRRAAMISWLKDEGGVGKTKTVMQNAQADLEKGRAI